MEIDEIVREYDLQKEDVLAALERKSVMEVLLR